ncbi:hypothetical protein [Candidatus Nitrosotenuis sp. DW1]|uniref:hypothetical protein n=1 Tax=Candidatus Nitrosotenuis sp. DW1 TaxID=2259672 RepID=UPI0015C7EE1E|nr:hypothetical protein [Candidatus Nitrosotenuis sp. DW1]QLH08580.1 hypothetical protein DSQ19_02990 [Candidatus Nitrosotenuis sp. DW1]
MNSRKRGRVHTKPKWMIREELEDQLRVLKRGKWITRSIIMTMLKIGIDKGGFSKNPTIKAKIVYGEGNHRPNTTFGVFELLGGYTPSLVKPAEDIQKYQEKGEVQFTENAFDVLMNDVNVYNQLDQAGLVNDSERREIKEFGELLYKFYGVRVRVP